jgi:hypothetical protein
MAKPEQDSSPLGNNEKRLIFDKKKGKWRMIRLAPARKEPQPNPGSLSKEISRKSVKSHGHPISPYQVQRIREGTGQYWQKRREAGEAPLSKQHADRVSEGLKRYWQEQRKQQH